MKFVLSANKLSVEESKARKKSLLVKCLTKARKLAQRRQEPTFSIPVSSVFL